MLINLYSVVHFILNVSMLNLNNLKIYNAKLNFFWISKVLCFFRDTIYQYFVGFREDKL